MTPHVLSLLAALILLSAASRADEPATIDDVERQIREAAERLQALDAEIVSGKARRAELETAMSDAESRAGERDRRIAGLDAEIERFDETLRVFEASVARESADIDSRRAHLADSLRETRRADQTTGLRVTLQQDDPALAARLGVYADYLLSAQQRTIDEQSTQLTRIETASARALKDRNWLEHIKRKARSQRDLYVEERDQGNAQLREVDTDLELKTRTVAELAADRDRLQTLMNELEALQSSASGYFASGKGRYGLPVDGTIAARFGDRKSVGRLTWNGLYFTARTGTPVRAVADGEIVYAARLRGFGLLVIVDHGDDFMTLYGGNRDLTHESGDWIEAGATIATVGDATVGDFSGQTIGATGGGLYFEIRQNAKPVDPELWLASEILSSGVADDR